MKSLSVAPRRGRPPKKRPEPEIVYRRQAAAPSPTPPPPTPDPPPAPPPVVEISEAARNYSTSSVLNMSKDPKTFKAQAEFLGIPEDKANSGVLSPGDWRVCLDIQIKNRIRRASRKKQQGETDEEVTFAVWREMQEFPGATDENLRVIKDRVSLFLQQLGQNLENDDEEVVPSKVVQIAPDGEEVTVFMEGADLAEALDPKLRPGPTVGIIKELVTPDTPDLVGDRPPTNLSDLYARWPIEGNDHFFLRIERTKPKTYNGINVAGLVAEVRGRRITEAEIQQTLGGAEYKITLYGPDPRSKDPGKSKALTDPFTVYVPVYPPNIYALPGTQFANRKPDSGLAQYKQQGPGDPTMMDPFSQYKPPTTPADATIRKAEIDFMRHREAQEHESMKERAKEQTRTSDSMFNSLSQFSTTLLTQMQEDARRREEQQARLLEEERRAREKLTESIGNKGRDSTDTLLQVLERVSPNAQAEAQRLEQMHQQQMNQQRQTHEQQLGILKASLEDQLRVMRERHEGDLRRGDERLKDTESRYASMLQEERGRHQQVLDQERTGARAREREVYEQFEKQIAQLKESFTLRIEDLKERHAGEVKQLERAQSQVSTMMKESFEVKSTVSEQTHRVMLSQAEQRLLDLKEEAERLREEAEEAKDIGKQLDRMKETAELLGFEKKDGDAPRTFWERMGSQAAVGLSNFFGTANEWLPKYMEQRAVMQQQQMKAAALMGPGQGQRPPQPGQRPSQQRPPQPAQQRQAPQASRAERGAQWATEGQHVEQPMVANPDLGVQSVPPPEDSENSNSRPTNGTSKVPQGMDRFMEYFPPEAMTGFITQVEQAMQTGNSPVGLADIFVSSYRDGAKVLVEKFRPEDIISAVRGIEGSEASPILRRDGAKWLNTFWQEVHKHLQRSPQVAPVTN